MIDNSNNQIAADTADSTYSVRYNNEIFVPVAALNEDFLFHTVQDAYEKAKHPDLLYFGIYNQKYPQYDFEDFSQFKNVKVVNVRCSEPLGVGVARVSAYMLHGGEQYVCPIDAHNFFVPEWDEELRKNYKKLREHFDKVILCQSAVYHRKEAYSDDKFRHSIVPEKTYPLKIDSSTGSTTSDFTRESEEKFLGKFIEHYALYAGTELFTESDFIYNIPHDYTVLHAPEQELTALRACTRGYRIFSSGKSTMSTLSKTISDSTPAFDYNNYKDSVQDSLARDGESSRHVKARLEVDHWSFLSGRKLGHMGALDIESYDKYISTSGYSFPVFPDRSRNGNLNKEDIVSIAGADVSTVFRPKTAEFSNIVVIENFIKDDHLEMAYDYCHNVMDWVSHSVSGMDKIRTARSIESDNYELFKIMKMYVDEVQRLIEHKFGRNLEEAFPGFRRWDAGEFQGVHADGETYDGKPNDTYIVDYGSIMYINDNYNGGEIYFPDYDMCFKPKAGTLVFFPSSTYYIHGVKPVISGVRYTSPHFWVPEKHTRLVEMAKTKNDTTD